MMMVLALKEDAVSETAHVLTVLHIIYIWERRTETRRGLGRGCSGQMGRSSARSRAGTGGSC